MLVSYSYAVYCNIHTCAAKREESTGFTAFLSASNETAAAFSTEDLSSFLPFLADLSFLELFSTLGLLSLVLAPMIVYVMVLGIRLECSFPGQSQANL